MSDFEDMFQFTEVDAGGLGVSVSHGRLRAFIMSASECVEVVHKRWWQTDDGPAMAGWSGLCGWKDGWSSSGANLTNVDYGSEADSRTEPHAGPS